MKIRAVLDTNVFISGIYWTGSSEKILRSWFEGAFTLISSLPIIDEIIKVMMAFRVPLDPEDISWWESLILEKSLLVFSMESLDIVKDDPDDNKFIEAAVGGNAKYIVSQDNHLLKLKEFMGIKIITPQEFINILSA